MHPCSKGLRLLPQRAVGRHLLQTAATGNRNLHLLPFFCEADSSCSGAIAQSSVALPLFCRSFKTEKSLRKSPPPPPLPLPPRLSVPSAPFLHAVQSLGGRENVAQRHKSFCHSCSWTASWWSFSSTPSHCIVNEREMHHTPQYRFPIYGLSGSFGSTGPG